jgi:hypothetical protein
MGKPDEEEKKEGIEPLMIVYFCSLQGGNEVKAKEAKQGLAKLGYEVGNDETRR